MPISIALRLSLNRQFLPSSYNNRGCKDRYNNSRGNSKCLGNSKYCHKAVDKKNCLHILPSHPILGSNLRDGDVHGAHDALHGVRGGLHGARALHGVRRRDVRLHDVQVRYPKMQKL